LKDYEDQHGEHCQQETDSQHSFMKMFHRLLISYYFAGAFSRQKADRKIQFPISNFAFLNWSQIATTSSISNIPH